MSNSWLMKWETTHATRLGNIIITTSIHHRSIRRKYVSSRSFSWHLIFYFCLACFFFKEKDLLLLLLSLDAKYFLHCTQSCFLAFHQVWVQLSWNPCLVLLWREDNLNWLVGLQCRYEKLLATEHLLEGDRFFDLSN